MENGEGTVKYCHGWFRVEFIAGLLCVRFTYLSSRLLFGLMVKFSLGYTARNDLHGQQLGTGSVWARR